MRVICFLMFVLSSAGVGGVMYYRPLPTATVTPCVCPPSAPVGEVKQRRLRYEDGRQAPAGAVLSAGNEAPPPQP